MSFTYYCVYLYFSYDNVLWSLFLVHACTLHIYMCLIIKILIPLFKDWHELILFDIMILCIIFLHVEAAFIM